MADVERTITVPVPLSTVWPYMSDFRNSTQWDPGTDETTLTSGDGGVGTVYHNVSSFMGKQTELDYEVQEIVPESRFVIRGENESVVATDTMTFNGDATSTTLTYHADFQLKGAAKLAAPALPAALKKLADDTAEQIDEHLRKL